MLLHFPSNMHLAGAKNMRSFEQKGGRKAGGQRSIQLAHSSDLLAFSQDLLHALRVRPLGMDLQLQHVIHLLFLFHLDLCIESMQARCSNPTGVTSNFQRWHCKARSKALRT